MQTQSQVLHVVEGLFGELGKVVVVQAVVMERPRRSPVTRPRLRSSRSWVGAGGLSHAHRVGQLTGRARPLPP